MIWLLGQVLETAQTYQSPSNRKSHAQIAALTEASSSGTGTAGYYKALDSYESYYAPPSPSFSSSFSSHKIDRSNDTKKLEKQKKWCQERARISKDQSKKHQQVMGCFDGGNTAINIYTCVKSKDE